MISFCALFLATAERIERVDSAKMVILQNREARRQREIFLTLEYCIEQQQWYLIAIESMEGIALGSDNRGGSVACWFTSGDFVVIDLTLNNHTVRQHRVSYFCRIYDTGNTTCFWLRKLPLTATGRRTEADQFLLSVWFPGPHARWSFPFGCLAT